MKIEAIDVLQLRNMPIPFKGKGRQREKLPVPDHGFSTVLQMTTNDADKACHIGLGEIRAIPYLTGETPNGAYLFARRLGRALIGAELPEGLDGWAAARATADLVTDATRSVMGIAEGDPLPTANSHPAVRFAFDAALLDNIARGQNKSVTALLGGETTPVRRNTFTRNFNKPSVLLNNLLKGNMPHGWLRGGFANNGTNLAAAMGAISAATNSNEKELAGVWFDLKGRWRLSDIELMLEGLSGTTPMRGSSLSVILEQPFPTHATAWYRDLFTMLNDDDNPMGDRLRVMMEVDCDNLASLEKALPHVDLKITPQKCGSIADLHATLETARAKGFTGSVYLGNAGMNTELNSIMLVTLAQVLAQDLDGEILLSANHKPESDSNIHQVYPQVTRDSEDPCMLTPPEGAGWGTVLCQSVLKKRLRKSDFLRNAGIAPDQDSLKTLLLMRAFDDSQLHIRRLDIDEDEDEADHDAHEADTDGQIEPDNAENDNEEVSQS